MKNRFIKLGLLSIFLIIISTIIILVTGRTFTEKFSYVKGNYQLNIDNYSGKIEVLDEKMINDNYYVKVKAKKPGRVYLELKDEQTSKIKIIYVHKTMVITDNTFFGKSTNSEVIPISIFIILTYLIYLLIIEYRKSIKENLYQYKNITYLGIIIFLLFFTLSIFLSIFNYQGLFDTISGIINSLSSVSILLLPVAFITFILVTISNIKLIIKEGKSLKNFLGVFFGVFICFLTIFPNHFYILLMKSHNINIFNLNSPGPYIYNFIESLIYLSVSYLECVLLGTIIIAIKSIKRKVEYNKDYMIILGCKIKNDGTLTPLLKGRVDRAIQFREEQLSKTGKDLVFISSGGKGNDEVISEAEAIKNYLIECDIKEKNIIVEEKSTNTYENINNSYKLIKNKDSNICFSTTNYHVLRAGLIATSQGIKIDGIGSKTKAYYWINAFIREFIGTLNNEKKKHIIVFILIVIVIMLMILITYFANNI